ncbi:hypothetical protein L218DRAFT_161423 [Marasmius fiardii PR-910]|nr:hypothetical protein L218DRAFT_161423 [Marasmius fiardii PR-910]
MMMTQEDLSDLYKLLTCPGAFRRFTEKAIPNTYHRFLFLVIFVNNPKGRNPEKFDVRVSLYYFDSMHSEEPLRIQRELTSPDDAPLDTMLWLTRLVYTVVHKNPGLIDEAVYPRTGDAPRDSDSIVDSDQSDRSQGNCPFDSETLLGDSSNEVGGKSQTSCESGSADLYTVAPSDSSNNRDGDGVFRELASYLMDVAGECLETKDEEGVKTSEKGDSTENSETEEAGSEEEEGEDGYYTLKHTLNANKEAIFKLVRRLKVRFIH